MSIWVFASKINDEFILRLTALHTYGGIRGIRGARSAIDLRRIFVMEPQGGAPLFPLYSGPELTGTRKMRAIVECTLVEENTVFCC
jgi:hypothetical protein